jgi:riboflavin synthase
MFTGIVEELGEVVSIEELGSAARICVRGPVVTSDVTLGDSISVDGCCLTVVARSADMFTADVMLETLKRTSIGALAPGDRVNLERAVRADSRLGGHIVQGHVDATGAVVERTPDEHWDLVRISMTADIARYIVPKGSIAVDGVSLTVVDVAPDSFTVSLIPATLEATTLGFKGPGDLVNLELDVIAKYVERLLAPHLAPTGSPPAATPPEETP